MRPTRTRGPALLRTTTFRIAILYLALFGLSALALLGFVYWTTAGFMARQTNETIRAEITGLAEQYRRDGLLRLTQIVLERSRNQRQSLYLLVGPSGTPLAGNLESWPNAEPDASGSLSFYYERPMGDGSEFRVARARAFLLRGGFHLLVGRDVSERRELDRLMRTALVWAMALTIGLGLVGGLFISRDMLRRIEAINRTSRDIMAGDLGRRVPVRGSGDELDRLAENLNAMLDQIEALMTGMRQVTDSIAHDLRSPLTRLRSRLELTLLQPPAAADYRVAIEQTIEEAERLLATFNALLSIAQAEAGANREALADLDLGALARDVAELYAPAAEEEGLELDLSAAEGLTIRGNRHLLSQALANLLDNAIKYTPAGGRVAVTVARSGAAADLVVADTGPGIPAADRDRVLDRFTRLEASRNTPGSGLGLSLVRAVAHYHHATLTLEDNAPGLRVRLRFEIRLA